MLRAAMSPTADAPQSRPSFTRSRTVTALGACALLALAGPAACNGNRGADAATAAPRELPPPTRPEGVLGHIHLGQPRSTGRSVGRFVGMPLPVDLLLMAQFGVDSTMLTTVELTRPVDVVVVGPPERPHAVASFVPGAMNTLRSTLQGRFRMTPVEGLGERLDPRVPDGPSASAPPEEVNGRRRVHAVCAIVPVPADATMPARVVCSDDVEALTRAGRWAAFSSRDYAEDHDDFVLRLEGNDARTVLATRVGAILRGLTDDLAESAARARRLRDRAPDLGDPEALVSSLREVSEDVPGLLRDVRSLTLRGAVRPEGISLTAEVPLDAAGTTALARDALTRAGAPMEHTLANRLAADAVAVLAARGSAERTRQQIHTATQTLLRVLGSRVSDPAAAQADLDALFAQTSDAVALSVAPDAPTAPTPAARTSAAPSASAGADPSAAPPAPAPTLEVLAVFSQADRGVAARAVIARMATAPWLRTAHLSESPLQVRTTRDGALVLRLPPAPAAAAPSPSAAPSAGDPSTPPPPSASAPSVPSELAIAVANDALVFAASPNAERALTAMAARATAGVAPRALTAVRPPAAVSFAFDPAPLMDPSQRGAEEDRVRNVLTVTYGATREADGLTARVQMQVPGSAISMLRRTVMGGRRRRRGPGMPPGMGPGMGQGFRGPRGVMGPGPMGEPEGAGDEPRERPAPGL